MENKNLLSTTIEAFTEAKTSLQESERQNICPNNTLKHLVNNPRMEINGHFNVRNRRNPVLQKDLSVTPSTFYPAENL